MTADTLIILLYIVVLSGFIGFELISKIPPTLHTPLLSATNAIAGVTIVGALLASGAMGWSVSKMLGIAALFLATINVVSGYVVTDRMLQMFKKKK
ncbi:NAD(P) transhydrogenase subunit alpha [Parapedobacter koreensis]|uniref:proton-translocating NAD(P)(+) transhydrogenase n=1 Tax=Parapedobacter koreensis TaxID=332977 RepID=A0A1H7MRZ9_9SPHI|nr:NAD(P) transhydrogenase subunit alpha [Parapedobacter koreensis]SEL13983.1 NAD(P) transhydrogenase subunit alpha [Parapedobacter koreensis]